MRRYESVVILDPELAEDDIKNLTERFRRIVGEFSGEIIKIEDWGLRKLAYLVKRRERGRYVFFDYVGVPALLSEMERQFKITEEVMKYLSVKLDDDVDLEAFRAQTKEPEPQPEAETAAVPQSASEPGPETGDASEPAAQETAANEEPPVADQGDSQTASSDVPEPTEGTSSVEAAPDTTSEPAQPVQAEQPAETPAQPGGES